MFWCLTYVLLGLRSPAQSVEFGDTRFEAESYQDNHPGAIESISDGTLQQLKEPWPGLLRKWPLILGRDDPCVELVKLVVGTV